MQRTFNQSSDNDPKAASQAAIARALERALSNLEAAEQNGWWSYVAEHGPSTEATAWCALAMQTAGTKAFDGAKTIAYLLDKQNTDGGWSTAPNCNISDWSTAPAVLALRLLKQKTSSNTKRIERAVIDGSDFLFDLRTDLYKSVARLLLFLIKGERGLDYARGWPWTRDCSFWVEPTSYSLIALKLPTVPDRQIIRQAIHHASQYLHEHVCADGGWNHGASFVLKIYAPAYSLTTAEALVALQDEPHSEKIEGALKFISQDKYDSDSSLPLSWSILALNAYGRELGSKTAKLLAHQNENGSFGTNNMVTAIAVLALITASRNYNLLKMPKSTGS